MKNIVVLIALLTIVYTAQAQKLVIGAKIPDMKGVKWLNAAPAAGKPMYIDFYQSTNATCKQNLVKIMALKDRFPQLTIVLLTRENNDAVAELISTYGGKISVGHDSDGKKYESFGVKFVPFSMVFTAKGTLFWQGNISQLADDQLKGL